VSDSFNRRSFLKKSALSVAAASVAANAAPGSRKFGSAGKEWPVYAGDQGATRYSPLDEIDRENVGNLKVAWRHQTGDAAQRPATRIQCTPIVVDGVMYLSTPRLKIQALDAATGKLRWSYDLFSEMRLRGNPGVNRGVCYWEDGDDKRIFVVIKDQLLSIDAKTGEPVIDRKRLEPGTYSSSPLLADGNIYATNEEGSTSVIQVGGEYEILAVNKLASHTLASPVAVDDQLYIRTAEHLYCIAKK